MASLILPKNYVTEEIKERELPKRKSQKYIKHIQTIQRYRQKKKSKY